MPRPLAIDLSGRLPAAGYNIVAIPLAAGVLPSWGVVLPAAVGAVLMSLSTVSAQLRRPSL
jgi:cation transport ATPase